MPARVTKSALPSSSPLHARRKAQDFLDCYKVASDLNAPEAAEIIVDFPGWAKNLVALRNLLTAPFGLRTDGPESKQKLGLFPVESSCDTEVIAGFNDRHLDFRVSVLAEQNYIHLATWVRPHNIGGRAYLRVILPFHILIARNALGRVARGAQPGQKFPLLE
ncbi:hypothetical protein ROLI_009820 [Roseobacter fucihabitans]|uniref:DUF2867 domain-containing protein n=1 Tax=Roseobacter fucihabitans TaxID=1537242 RepID=A0ABZ2BQA7_9RHOB|nr:DUF2867 domain-containing protein [Roseobacter litoralis]MBC6967921.1 hypothetical protein [Roseobacter litoralis]